ncbi:glutamate racemase [Caldanaerobacter subterraneus subsp. tengcongensis MB4]|nr:glutamate racemase [Caldanaerobacter subterraneus]MBE3579637.1 glutamate racemase [Caldanaerobacter subterraneus]MCS3915986.1 glutamate racemase [Caldanaerobacter subterraneus subsp. tengcongensis MB4]
MRYFPIGVFDSGVGGLTVLKRLMEVLPQENYVYFGDTRRVPYGDRSKEEIKAFTKQIMNFLKKKNVKIFVIACNTISAVFEKEGKEIVFNVVEAGVKSAVETTCNKRIGVIGTRRTTEERIYSNKIKEINKSIEVYEVACPELVPLIEKGFYKTESVKRVVIECVKNLKEEKIDTLVLGCTHYPIVIDYIEEALIGENVRIVDPAERLAYDVKEYITRVNMINPNGSGQVQFYLSKMTQSFIEIAKILLEGKINNYNVSIVDITKY